MTWNLKVPNFRTCDLTRHNQRRLVTRLWQQWLDLDLSPVTRQAFTPCLHRTWAGAARQNTIKNIIISDAVYTGCGMVRHDKSQTVNWCISSAEHKGRYSEECGKQINSGALMTSIVFFFSYYGSQQWPKTAWLQPFFKISSFVFVRTNLFIQVWNYEGE